MESLLYASHLSRVIFLPYCDPVTEDSCCTYFICFMVAYSQMVNSLSVTLPCYIFKPDFEPKLYTIFRVVTFDKFLKFPMSWFSHLLEEGNGSKLTRKYVT